MKDVTGLDRIDFNAILDLREIQSSTAKSSSKTLNFVEKCGQLKDIREAETGEILEPPVIEKLYLRGRTRN